jgi:hypothetical protein
MGTKEGKAANHFYGIFFLIQRYCLLLNSLQGTLNRHMQKWSRLLIYQFSIIGYRLPNALSKFPIGT